MFLSSPPPPPPYNPTRLPPHLPSQWEKKEEERANFDETLKGSFSFNGNGHVFVPALTKIVVVPPKTTASGTPVNKIRLLFKTTEQPKVGGIHDTSFSLVKLPWHFNFCGKCPVPTYLVYHLCVHECTYMHVHVPACTHARMHTHILFTFRIIPISKLLPAIVLSW